MNDTSTTSRAATRRLERPREGRMLAGVCEGLARYFDVDPVIFRIVFAVAAVAGGAGLLAYVVAWVLMPEEGSARAIAGRGAPSWLPYLLLVLGVAAFADGFGRRGWGFGWGVIALAGAAFLIWKHSESTNSAGSTATPTPNLAQKSSATDEFRAEFVEEGPAAPPEPRSVLGRVTWSVLLIAAGVALLLDRSNAMHVTLEGFLGVALLIVAVALLLGAWVGRALGLIAVGVLLTTVAAAASVIDVPVRGGVGDRTWTPVADVRPLYRWGIGDAELDLRGVTDRVDTDIRLGIGRLVVTVPADATVDVDAHVGAGNLDLLGRRSDGVDVDRRVIDREGELGPRIHLDVRVGAGEVEVRRAAA